MKIYFYNLFHLGDLLFNKALLQNICESNPDQTFYMISKYNSHLFSDIPNLQYILYYHINFLSENHNSDIYFIYDNNLYINLWIGVTYFHTIPNISLNDCECNIINQLALTKYIFNRIYSQYNITIKLNINNNLLLPIIPNTNISIFLEWYESHKNNTLIMYFNYIPKSGQTVPFSSHTNIILFLAKNIPDSYILLPFISNDLQNIINKLQINNIIDCSLLFNCTEEISCENISKLIKISEYCNYSIHYDIGACFYYLNQNIYNSKNIILHCGVNNKYYNKIISSFNINTKLDIINHKIKFLLSDNDSSIVNNILESILK